MIYLVLLFFYGAYPCRWSMRPHTENRHRSREAPSKFRVLISFPAIEQYSRSALSRAQYRVTSTRNRHTSWPQLISQISSSIDRNMRIGRQQLYERDNIVI